MRIMIKKFHNLPNAVKKSIAEQSKLTAWVMGAVNGFFMHVFGNVVGVLSVIIWWAVFQYIAHYILYNLDNQENHIDKEQ